MRRLLTRLLAVSCIGVTPMVAAASRSAAAPTPPTVAIGAASIAEGDGGSRVLVLPLTLSEPSSVPVTIRYVLSGVEATPGRAGTPGADFDDKGGYAAAPRSVTLRAGMVEQSIPITVYADQRVEGDESVSVEIVSAPAGYSVPNPYGVGVILDDDQAPFAGVGVRIGDSAILEGTRTKRVLNLPVALTRPAASTVTVSYRIVGDTATGGYKGGNKPPIGSDFADGLGATKTLVFKAGPKGTPVVKNVAVTLYPDSTPELDESFHVLLTGVSGGGATVLKDSGLGLIVNDEGVGTATDLTSIASTVAEGVPSQLRATVTADDASTVGGTVTFREGTAVIGTAAVVGGIATLEPVLARGTHTIVATYDGDADHVPSTSAPYDQQVLQATTTLLTSEINPAQVDTAVHLTATVSAPVGIPTGSVEIRSGVDLLGSAPLVNGVATITGFTNVIEQGDYDLYAVYTGDPSNAPSASTTVHQVIAPLPAGQIWNAGCDGPYGTLGDGLADDFDTNTFHCHLTPAPMGLDTDWTAVADGGDHMLALKADGTLWAWGNDFDGQIGGLTVSYVPRQVGTDTDWVKIAAGERRSYGLKSDGTLWRWGRGFGADPSTNVPTRVDARTDWASISASDGHVMGLHRDGSLWGFGRNDLGEVGTGDTIDVDAPVRIGSDRDWSFVTVGPFDTLAVKNDGTLWTWGANDAGQLGIGSTTDAHVPTQVGTDTDWATGAIGQTGLAIKADGSLWGWGWNFYGTIGNSLWGIGADRTSPVHAGQGLTFRSVSISRSSREVAAIATSGSLYVWGYQAGFRLGRTFQPGDPIDALDVHYPARLGHARNWSSVLTVGALFAITG